MRRTIGILLTAAALGGSTLAMTAAPAMASCKSGYVCMWSNTNQRGTQTNIKVSNYSQGKNYNINIWLPEASYLGSIYNNWSSRVWANQKANGPTGTERCYAAKGGSGNPDALVGTAVNFVLFGATGATTC